MQIDRQVLEGRADPSKPRPCCPLECVECQGLCLSVYMLLTPAEQAALSQANSQRIN